MAGYFCTTQPCERVNLCAVKMWDDAPLQKSAWSLSGTAEQISEQKLTSRVFLIQFSTAAKFYPDRGQFGVSEPRCFIETEYCDCSRSMGQPPQTREDCAPWRSGLDFACILRQTSATFEHLISKAAHAIAKLTRSATAATGQKRIWLLVTPTMRRADRVHLKFLRNVGSCYSEQPRWRFVAWPSSSTV